MTLPSLLRRHRSALLDTWIERTLSSYPGPTAARLRKERDPFMNPVGSTLRTELAAILDGVLDAADPRTLAGPLDAIVRIRAIQDFDPSQAVGFLFDLKQILRARAGAEVGTDELHELLGVVDGYALRAFDIYSACREKVFEIRIGEIRNQTHRALQQAGVVGHEPRASCGGSGECDTERGPQS